MGVLEDELDRMTRANRPLTMSESIHINMPHRLEVGVPLNERSRWQDIRVWCEENIRELWTSHVKSRNTEYAYVIYKFTGAQDAMLFRLTWGGRIPPKPYLP